MNLCLVLFQAIIFAVLLVQYQFIQEVDAEKQTSFSVGNWFSSIEKKINVQFPYDAIEYDANASECSDEIKKSSSPPVDMDRGVMSDVMHNIKKTAEEIVQIPRRLADRSLETNQFPNKKGVIVNDEGLDQDWADINAVGHDASDLTGEKKDQNNETPSPETANYRKKRIKKHKRKGKNHERVADVSIERDLAEFGRKVKKDRKKKLGKRRFVKTLFKQSNSSKDSNESIRRGKPVDIIVHIKMNE